MTPYPRLHAPRPTRLAVRAAILGWLGCAAAGGALSAQVGYDPAHSPYRDTPGGGVAVVSLGYLGGSRGSVGVGLSNGATGGLPFEGPVGPAPASPCPPYGPTTRLALEPPPPAPTRQTGPYANPVV